MSTVADILRRVETIVQDPSLATLESVIQTLNDQIPGEILARIKMPALLASATVTASLPAVRVALPNDFRKDLTQVVNASNGRPVVIERNSVSYAQRFPLENLVGSPLYCTIASGFLYYQPAPAAPGEALKLWYTRKWVPLSAGTDWPDGFPDDTPIDLFAYLCAWKMFELIEDGISTPRLNTRDNMERFIRARGMFETNMLNGDTTTFGGFRA